MSVGVKSRPIVLFLSVLFLTLSASAKDPKLVRIEKADGEGTAFTASGKVQIELRENWVEAAGRKGPRLLSLLVLFEPKSGAFSWRVTDAANDESAPSYRLQEFKTAQAAYLKDGEFFDFRSLVGPLRLFIRRSRGHARDLDDADQQSIRDASETVDPQTDLLIGKDVRAVPLLALGWDFVLPLGSAIGGRAPVITNVQWDQESRHWNITLRANWTEEVTLDQDYNVLALKRTQ